MRVPEQIFHCVVMGDAPMEIVKDVDGNYALSFGDTNTGSLIGKLVAVNISKHVHPSDFIANAFKCEHNRCSTLCKMSMHDIQQFHVMHRNPRPELNTLLGDFAKTNGPQIVTALNAIITSIGYSLMILIWICAVSGSMVGLFIFYKLTEKFTKKPHTAANNIVNNHKSNDSISGSGIFDEDGNNEKNKDQ
jgi:hypothetical protein